MPYFNATFQDLGASNCKFKTEGCDSDVSTRTGTPSAFEEDDARSQVHAEFGEALVHIARKMPETFGTLRRAIRHADGGNRGFVSKSEMRYFFRAFNLPAAIADRFHARLAGLANTPDVGSHDLAECLSPYIDPELASLPSKKSSGGGHTRRASKESPPSNGSDKEEEHPEGAIRLDVASLAKESIHRQLAPQVGVIGSKLPLKF